LGKIWGQVTASDYHTRRVEQLFPQVTAAYGRLAARHDLILLEGAGSPAEINLREHDIVNMRMAHAADAVCLLIGDIDRGGVFASLVGTMELLQEEDRGRIRGFVINKFRGDRSLLDSGVTAIERRLRLPCAGVVPFLPDLGLDEEDGVALADRPTVARRWINLESGPARALRIGVVALPHMANFTDFDAFEREPTVSLAYLENADELSLADVIILPGTKQTLDDLRWLEARGFVYELQRQLKNGTPIIGICGGYQMLGLVVEDPDGVENDGKSCAQTALGFLPVRTVLRSTKTVRRIKGTLHREFFRPDKTAATSFEGYEIHVGETFFEGEIHPLADVEREGETRPVGDGAVTESGRVFGTYVHGLFDNDALRHSFIQSARTVVDLVPATTLKCIAAEREARIDRLANHLRQSMDMSLIKSWIVEPPDFNPPNSSENKGSAQ
jgi:adenosylcobyric acid synthase